jgi:hypothetical protein
MQPKAHIRHGPKRATISADSFLSGNFSLAEMFGLSCLSKIFFGRIREYWMIYRRPGFLAVVWFGSSPLPISKLSLFLGLPVCRPSSLLTGEGRERGWARNQIIRPRESLALYKSFNCFWSTPTLTRPGRECWRLTLFQRRHFPPSLPMRTSRLVQLFNSESAPTRTLKILVS